MSRFQINRALYVVAAVAILGSAACADVIEDNEQNNRLFVESCPAIRDYLKGKEVLVPPYIMARAELGDHFETINVDRPDTHNAFGNPDARVFSSISGSDGPADKGGTYGIRNGGGRRLMVTRRSFKFMLAILACARAGYENKVKENPIPEKAAILKAQINALVSTDEKLQEEVTKALLESKMLAVNLLIDALDTTTNVELQTRIKTLLKKIHLRTAVDAFREEHED